MHNMFNDLYTFNVVTASLNIILCYRYNETMLYTLRVNNGYDSSVPTCHAACLVGVCVHGTMYNIV